MDEKRLREFAGLNEAVSHEEADKRAAKLTKDLFKEVSKILKKKGFKDFKTVSLGETFLVFFDDEVDYQLQLGIVGGVDTLGISRFRKSPRKE